MNPINEPAHFEKMIYKLHKQLNSTNKNERKEAKSSIKNLPKESFQSLTTACLRLHEKTNKPRKILEHMPFKTISLKMLSENIAKLKSDEIFKGIFFQFENEWKQSSPTHKNIKSFIEQNKEIISTASIKNPALWMTLSNQIRHNPKCSISTKVQLLWCENKLLELTNKQSYLLETREHLPHDLKSLITNQIPYKNIEELLNNISKMFFINEFKNVNQFSHWIEEQKIPIQLILSLAKGHKLPFASSEWIPALKCLHVGKNEGKSIESANKYEILAQSLQKMGTILELNFDIAGGDENTEKFLTPFGIMQKDNLKVVNFFVTEWWSQENKKPLEEGALVNPRQIEHTKKANDAVYVPFLSFLNKVETFSMKDFPMGIGVLSALPISLKWLSISNCALSDTELLALKHLKNLERLNLEWCPSLTEGGIQALKTELPHLHISILK